MYTSMTLQLHNNLPAPDKMHSLCYTMHFILFL